MFNIYSTILINNKREVVPGLLSYTLRYRVGKEVYFSKDHTILLLRGAPKCFPADLKLDALGILQIKFGYMLPT
jgi:hypothetical protein